MRVPVLLALFSVVAWSLTGCSKAPPAPPKGDSGPLPVGAVEMPDAEQPPEQPGGPDPQQLAAEYAQKLLKDQDPGARAGAAEALSNLGEVGLPHVLAGLQNGSAEVRLKTLEGLNPSLVGEHQKVMIPILLRLVQDQDAKIRELACQALVYADLILPAVESKEAKVVHEQIQAGMMLKERHAALLFAAAKDKWPEVREAAMRSLTAVQQAMKGVRDPGPAPPSVEGEGPPPAISTGARGEELLAPKREFPRR